MCDVALANLLLHLHAWAHAKNQANAHGYDPAAYPDIANDREWLWAQGTHVAAWHSSPHVFIVFH